MRTYRRSAMRRPILWIIPIVLTTVTAMLVMQYRFLRRLEVATASAQRNGQRTALELAARGMENDFRLASQQALTIPAEVMKVPCPTGDHFRRHRVPAAKTYFTIHFADHDTRICFFDAAGNPKQVSAQEQQAITVAKVASYVLHHDGTMVAARTMTFDVRDSANRIVAMPITDASMRVIGAAGFVLDEGAARDYVVNTSIPLLRKSIPADDYVTVRAGESRVFGSAGGARAFLTQPLGFVFSDWQLGLRDACLTPEEIAAENFRINALWSGGVALVLLAALALAMQAALRQMKLSQMKSDFVSNVSHELRTPLSSIRVFGEYMRLGRVTSDEKIREYGGYIENEGRRLTTLINNILDFSKIESAEKRYKFCPTDIGELVARTVDAFETPGREQGRHVDLQLPPQAVMGSIDRDAFAQALVNLLDNAVKYSSDPRDIAVKVAAGGGTIRVTVRDHGIGIAAGEQKKIFEKFYRVGSSLVHDIKGSGLGLSIVQHIVRAHGGTVEVESEPGKGSAFTIVLPMIPAYMTAQAPVEEHA